MEQRRTANAGFPDDDGFGAEKSSSSSSRRSSSHYSTDLCELTGEQKVPVFWTMMIFGDKLVNLFRVNNPCLIIEV